MSLRAKAFSGVRWTTASSLGRVALQLLQVAVLARLLTPADFGLVAVVIALTAILQIFSDAGVSNALIHFQDVTREETNSLYWLNVAISAAIAIVLMVASPFIARSYGEPTLQGLLTLSAVTLFVTALGQQLRVLAQKELRFVLLAKVELGGAVIGCIVAIGLAFFGAQAYALIGGSFATAAATSALAWILLGDGWIPGVPQWERAQRFLRFGIYIIGNNLVNTFNTQVDVLLGARLLGPASIGLYSVPKDLSLRLAGVINPIVTEVSFPVMAAAQGDRALLRRMYLQMMRMTASVTFPVYVAMAVFAPDIVRVALGVEWQSAGPILRILAIWAAMRSIGNPVGTLLMAVGRPGLSFVWNLGLLAVMPPTIWFGSRYGLEGMSFAMTVLAALIYLPNWYFLVRPLCGATLGEYSAQLGVPAGIALLAGAAGFIAASSFSVSVLRLIAGGFAGGATYLCLSWYWNQTWAIAMFELARVQRPAVRP